MNEKETLSSDNGQTIFEQGITELIHEQFLFAESVYARLPISIEMYDTDGILRFINDHALKMYGVNDPECSSRHSQPVFQSLHGRPAQSQNTKRRRKT